MLDDALLDAIEVENERLRGRIDQLEAAMGMKMLTPIEWCLTGQETRVFGVLMARTVATKDAVMASLYRNDGKDEAEIKIVDVFICKIRKKLRPFGVEIKTRWGEGYFLEPATKAAVSRMISDSAGIAA